MKQARTLEGYLSAVYPIAVERHAEGWEVWHPDFTRMTISAFADTLEAAIRDLDEMREYYIISQFDKGVELPFPEEPKLYSGSFVLRIPKDLHARLAHEAKENNVSLNSYIQHLLAQRHDESATQRGLETIALKLEEPQKALQEHEKPLKAPTLAKAG